MIIYNGGGKGGVGKSIKSMIDLYYFISKGEKPILIETDTDNPDVFKAYGQKTENGYIGKDCDIYAFNIDTASGWEKALDVIGENEKRPIIINSGARNTMSLTKYGDVLNEFPEFITSWLINNKADSLNLLGQFMKIVNQPICVVKNGFFGDPDDFSAFDNSKAAKAGMKSVYLPAATEAVTDALYTKRHAINELANDGVLTFGQRLMARSWLKKISNLTAECLNNAQKITIE